MIHKILTCFLILCCSTSIDISFLWGFHGKNFFSVVTSARLQNRISLLSSPQNSDFGIPPGVSITFWESESLVKKFCSTTEANNSKNVCIEEGKKNSFIFLCHSFPHYCGLVPGKIHVKCNVSHRGKWNCMSECLVSPAIRNVRFFLTLPRLLRWSEKRRGYERLGSLPGLKLIKALLLTTLWFFLLNHLWTPSGFPPSPWAPYLQTPLSDHRFLQCFVYLTHTTLLLLHDPQKCILLCTAMDSRN